MCSSKTKLGRNFKVDLNILSIDAKAVMLQFLTFVFIELHMIWYYFKVNLIVRNRHYNRFGVFLF